MKSLKWTSAFWVFLNWALINADAENSRFKDISNQASKSGAAEITSVVSHEVCESALTDKEKAGKRNLNDVHTFAELKEDPKADFPPVFTICSSAMTTDCPATYTRVLFNILDDNKKQLLVAKISVLDRDGSAATQYKLLYSRRGSRSKNFPPLFSHRWIRSCVAINKEAGLIQWVVNGELVLEVKSEEFISLELIPKNLTGKLILGANSYKDSTEWYAESNKVTNINIFSFFISQEKMEEMTRGQGDCVEDGDYLAWRDMEWILHGHAALETVKMAETCEGDPWANLYFASFLEMKSCMPRCQKLGSRVPPVSA